ncbi:MAG: M13 family metallopeptidase [Bacteroidales bacterium]|nr:M13 family metallopeptidase [Bacteroidales bacterium]
MKKISYFILICGGIMLSSCGNMKKAPEQVAYDLANLDTTMAPGVDFYQYACGGWMKNHPMKAEYSRFGTFDKLGEDNRDQLRSLVEELSSKSNADRTVAQKIGSMYNLGMDSVALNKEAATPIVADLAKVNAIKDKNELPAYLAEAIKSGVGGPFNFYIYADDMNSSMNIAHIAQGGLSLPDREYYVANDANSQKIRKQFVEFMTKMFDLVDKNTTINQQKAATVLKIETQLAKAHFTKEALRDPMKNYHMIAVSELQKDAPDFAWTSFFNAVGLKDLKKLNVAQIEPITEVSTVLRNYSLDEIKTYLSWQVLNSSASYLSDDFEAANFEFYDKTLSGKQENKPRWKRVLGTTDGVLGEAIGQMYVEKYFSAGAKARMLKLVDNLKTALSQRIQGLEWMSPETKTKALEKLTTFRVKIGYPDKWRDYTKLDITSKESYWANVKKANQFEFDYMLGKANKPVDKDEWLMTPQTVNAYYNPATNEICFPAAILQPPFFNLGADDAVNYGAIGVVIGHEMTHGFDDQGSQYDKDGNLKNWWSKTDLEKFNARTKSLATQYSKIIVLDSLHANGEFTLGENIADQGGLQVSFLAFQNTLRESSDHDKIDGLTPEQRFFLSYSNVWAGNIRNEEIIRRTQTDPHSLGKWRVNGALPNVEAWYKAFNIKPGDPMYIAPEKRAIVW